MATIKLEVDEEAEPSYFAIQHGIAVDDDAPSCSTDAESKPFTCSNTPTDRTIHAKTMPQVDEWDQSLRSLSKIQEHAKKRMLLKQRRTNKSQLVASASAEGVFCGVCGMRVSSMTTAETTAHFAHHTWMGAGKFMCENGCKHMYFPSANAARLHRRGVHGAESTTVWNHKLVPIVRPLSIAQRQASYAKFCDARRNAVDGTAPMDVADDLCDDERVVETDCHAHDEPMAGLPPTPTIIRRRPAMTQYTPLFCELCGLLVHPRTAVARAKEDWTTSITRHSHLHVWIKSGANVCRWGCAQTFFLNRRDLAEHHRGVHGASSTCVWNRPLVPWTYTLTESERWTEYHAFRKTHLSCAVCALEFSTAADWQRHRLEHDAAIGDGQWPCTFCATHYSATADALRAHLRERHADVKVVVADDDEDVSGTTGTDEDDDSGESIEVVNEGAESDTGVCEDVKCLVPDATQPPALPAHLDFEGSTCTICGKEVALVVARPLHAAQHVKSVANGFGAYECARGCERLYLRNATDQSSHHLHWHDNVFKRRVNIQEPSTSEHFVGADERTMHIAQHVERSRDPLYKPPRRTATPSSNLSAETAKTARRSMTRLKLPRHILPKPTAPRLTVLPSVPDPPTMPVLSDVAVSPDGLFNGGTCRVCNMVIPWHLGEKRRQHTAQHQPSAANGYGRYSCRRGCNTLYFASLHARAAHHADEHGAMNGVRHKETSSSTTTMVDGGGDEDIVSVNVKTVEGPMHMDADATERFDGDACRVCGVDIAASLPRLRLMHARMHAKVTTTEHMCRRGCPLLYFATSALVDEHHRRIHPAPGQLPYGRSRCHEQRDVVEPPILDIKTGTVVSP